MVDQLFVIHCKRLRERREHLEGTLRRLGWTGRWITDFDPPEIPRETWRRRGSRSLRKEEASLYLKHLAAYREMVDSAIGAALVLEDDAVLPDGFPSLLDRYLAALPADCDMAFFATSIGRDAPPLPEHPLYANGHGTRSTCAYLIVRPCAERLLEHLERRPITRPIDLTLDQLVREWNLVTYWSVPAIIEQGSETGLFAHSLGVSWRDPRLSARLVHRIASTLRTWLR